MKNSTIGLGPEPIPGGIGRIEYGGISPLFPSRSIEEIVYQLGKSFFRQTLWT